ncbi:unnamed protein product [Ciceribacter selenitireducens ATCC BAA-1503]|uniref:Uncharacterized protein n=1 Tax=Ciceribacter selenitireducens ATCC BAA-1503 TaxID=1336235 RepID=A0A376AG66_9HYPH|nr:unnamed protein product [Ciceribacter selenitireducens ATCC BAA-1503]
MVIVSREARYITEAKGARPATSLHTASTPHKKGPWSPTPPRDVSHCANSAGITSG